MTLRTVCVRVMLHVVLVCTLRTRTCLDLGMW